MLPVLAPLFRRDGELDSSDDEADLLVATSAATLDRPLAGAKVLAGVRTIGHSKPGSLLATQPPSGLVGEGPRRPASSNSTWSATREGLLRRLVLHPADDRHRHRLGLRSVTNKAALRGTQSIEHASGAVPFPIKGIDLDGKRVRQRPLPPVVPTRRITFTRSRPGNKNDGRQVGEKDGTHVRWPVGTLRCDTGTGLDVLNRI